MAVTSLASMPFVHPGLAGAAILTGLIPVLIHLINRRRYRRVPWAAMSFLLAANRRSSRRMRLEQWLLMAARVALIVLLGLAVARPFMPASAVLPTSFSRVHRIIVLDNSLSMSAKGADGRTRFAAAQQCAADLVSSFPPTDAVSLVTMSAPAEAVIAQAAYDRRWLRESMSTLRPVQSVTDVSGAVTVVLEILKESPAAEGNRVVYVVSDFTRRDWESATPQDPTNAVRAIRQLADALPDPATDLYLISVENGANDNLAITRLEPESSLIGINAPVRVLVEVVNYGAATARSATLQVRRDGLIVRRETLPPLAPGASTVSTLTTEFTVAGTHALEARLGSVVGNSLEADDSRYLSVEAREERPVLLVDGRPGLKALEGQAGFLATALAPGGDGARAADARAAAGRRRDPTGRADRERHVNLFTPKTIDETELESEILSQYDAVVLCNVPRLSPPQWDRLQRFVSLGGGVLFSLGEFVSIENYNRLGHASGAGLIPGKLGRPVIEAGDGRRDPSEQGAGDDGGFKMEPHPHPIIAEFGDHAASGLFRARVQGYVPFEPDSGRAEVVLRYTGGAPALIASTFGKGRVLMWTTSVNMDWTNLPAKGDFVGLVHNAFAYLVPQRGRHRNVRVGDRVTELLTPTESSSSLRVTEDDGAVHEPTLVLRDESLALEYGPIERAQLLTLSVGSENRALAANVDPVESDLSSLDTSKLAAVLDRPARILTDRQLSDAQPSAARSTELASLALYVVLAILLAELWLAMRFGAPREPAGRAPLNPGAEAERASGEPLP